MVPLTATSLLSAQAGVLICATVLLSIAAAYRERWFLAALCVLLAVSVKVYPIALALLLFMCFPRRLLLPALAAMLVVAALPFAFQNSSYVAAQYMDWPRLLASADRADYNGPSNCDVRLLYGLLQWQVSRDMYRLQELLIAGGMAALCFAASLARWPRPALLNLAFALAVCWMTVFGPAVETYGYALLAPILAAAIVDSVQNPMEHRPRRAVLLASWSLFACAAMALWFPFGRAIPEIGPHALAGMLLFAVLLLDAWRAFFRKSSERRPGGSSGVRPLWLGTRRPTKAGEAHVAGATTAAAFATPLSAQPALPK
jgi:hypothetical protein